MSSTSRRWLAWSLALVAASTAVALACGPFFTDLRTVTRGTPVDRARYARGELGVVKPTFERRYLVQAYRRLGGLPPLPAPVPTVAAYRAPTQSSAAFSDWIALQKRELPPAFAAALKPISPERTSLPDYSSFDNCLEPAFAAAIGAYQEHVARYGARSIETVEWLTAQATVFQNCAFGPLALPAQAPPGTDARVQADRDYQIAAAYFYATQYDEAAGRFRAIASNAMSPWRSSGRYLAARALIRSVTVPSTPPKDVSRRLTAAGRDLEATLADRDATALHASARGLLDYIAVLARPMQRLHELSARLSTALAVAPQEVVDYTRLMDRALGQTPAATPPVDLSGLTSGDDLTDWIVAMQKGGPRAGERWIDARSERWLIAALWTADARGVRTPELIAAAAQVPPTSPAFATAVVLRVGLLIQRGELAAARTALAALPSAPAAGLDAETLNLLRAARFTVAATLDDMLAAAPRTVVNAEFDGNVLPPEKFTKPVWDDDVAAVFDSRMPLEQLVAAAESARLPPRLRVRVAQAAFTRAVLLDRPKQGVRAARVLSTLAPAMRADLGRYIGATDEDARRRVATLTLLRTPGLSINTGGRDTDDSYARDTPARRFGHWAFDPGNWWCAVDTGPGDGAARLIAGSSVSFPPFVDEAGRRDTAAELEALEGVGPARNHLMSTAITWAETRRADPEAAEALALAIEGWRWSPCSYGAPESDLPRRAFTLLHRQFPDSDWALRTKYWYD